MCPRVRSLKSFHKFAPLIPTTCVVQDPCIRRHTHSLHKLRCPRMTSLDGSLPTASGRRRCCHRHAKRKLAKTAAGPLRGKTVAYTYISSDAATKWYATPRWLCCPAEQGARQVFTTYHRLRQTHRLGHRACLCKHRVFLAATQTQTRPLSDIVLNMSFSWSCVRCGASRPTVNARLPFPSCQPGVDLHQSSCRLPAPGGHVSLQWLTCGTHDAARCMLRQL